MAAERDNLVIFRQSPVQYGSIPRPSRSLSDPEDGRSTLRHVIYCVHGKPNGCCVVTECEVYTSAQGTESVPQNLSSINVGEHCHRLQYTKVDRKARRKLVVASVLCVIFMIGEVIGGVLSNSLAIATDAAHLLTDFASFMISLFSLWMASRPATRTLSFGWHRAEVIGALTSVLMIWVVTGILVYMAVLRVIHRDFEIDSEIMLITSAVGILVNLIMGCTLHQHGHSHTSASESQQNINVRAAFIHVIGDFIQSLGVFVAALVIYFKPEWVLVDPICTFIFSVLVMMTTFAIIKDTMLVLMEGIPKGVDFTAVMNTFLQIEGVVRVHNLRIWALSIGKTALSAHLAVRPGVSPQEVLSQASRSIHSRFQFFEMTLQIEEFRQDMEECVQCRSPEK